ncbi:UNVERIFIED_CONTAM: hypothetical protein RMT77_014463 [Armadillidium vulgare]
MNRSSNKGTGKESDAEAREEIARDTKRNLFILKKDFKIALNKLSKVISKGKIALIQGENTDQLKQTVKELEQVLEEAEAKLQVYVNNMEILEMFDDIKEEEMLEITQSEAQKVRVQIYTLIARQERENDAADSSEVREDSLKSTSECKAVVNHSIVAFQAETKEIHKHENVRKDERTKSEDKIKMELENQKKVLAKELENTKAHLKERENLIQEKAAIIKEFHESKQILESRVEDILKCKENDRLFNEERNAKLEQQRLLERQRFEALLNEKEREKRNLLDIIQGKENALHENKGERLEMQIMLQRVKNEKLETENTLQETEQKMASFIKERELEIKNLHAVNESEKRNLSKEISEANSEIQRLRELLTKRDQVMLKAKKENEDSIKEGQDADADHSNEEPFLISKLENERAEVLPQMKNNKESIQAKLERFQEKGKREFSEMDKERQKTKVQLGKKRGALIKGRMKKRVHFEKLKKEGKERTSIKNENTRNNWRLAIARRAFICQVRRVKRAWLRLGKRNLGNHRKRKRRPVPVVLSVPRGTGDPHQGAIFISKLSQFRRSHVAAFVKAEEVSREILSMSHYRLASFPSSWHFSH